MKIQLIDSRQGIVKAIILKEWMRIGLSICLLGLPVILGYFSIQMAEARNAEFAKNSPAPALGDEFDFSPQTAAMVQNKTLEGHAVFAQQAVASAVHNLQQLRQATFSHGPVTGKYQWLEPFADYGNLLTKGLLLAKAYASESFTGFVIHKTGRVIDPASYIHSTIR